MLAVKRGLLFAAAVAASTLEEKVGEAQMEMVSSEIKAYAMEQALVMSTQYEQLADEYSLVSSNLDSIVEENDAKLKEMESHLAEQKKALVQLRQTVKHMRSQTENTAENHLKRK